MQAAWAGLPPMLQFSTGAASTGRSRHTEVDRDRRRGRRDESDDEGADKSKIPCSHYDFGRGTCNKGKKCKFLHAEQKPRKELTWRDERERVRPSRSKSRSKGRESEAERGSRSRSAGRGNANEAGVTPHPKGRR